MHLPLECLLGHDDVLATSMARGAVAREDHLTRARIAVGEGRHGPCRRRQHARRNQRRSSLGDSLGQGHPGGRGLEGSLKCSERKQRHRATWCRATRLPRVPAAATRLLLTTSAGAHTQFASRLAETPGATPGEAHSGRVMRGAALATWLVAEIEWLHLLDTAPTHTRVDTRRLCTCAYRGAVVYVCPGGPLQCCRGTIPRKQ